MQYPSEYEWPNLESWLKNEAGISISEIYPIDEVDPNHPDLPEGWKPLIGASREETLELLWGKARPYFPLFTQAVYADLEGIFFAISHIGPVLLYFMTDWGEYQELQGMFYGGPPATLAEIEEFELKIGKMPQGIVALWQSHSFIQLLESGCIYSFAIKTPLGLEIKNMGLKKNEDDPNEILECLMVDKMNYDSGWAITRSHPNEPWSDRLVCAEIRSDTFAPFIYDTLDEFMYGRLDPDSREAKRSLPYSY